MKHLLSMHKEKRLVFLKNKSDLDDYLIHSQIKKQNFFLRNITAVAESRGRMDFAVKYLRDEIKIGLSIIGTVWIHKIDPLRRMKYGIGAFFLYKNRAYNLMDFGNFLWGKAMARAGHSRFWIHVGSNANEFWRGGDDKADQRAISAGVTDEIGPITTTPLTEARRRRMEIYTILAGYH